MSNNQVQLSILNPASVIYGILGSHIKRHHCINQNLKVGWSWLKFQLLLLLFYFCLLRKWLVGLLSLS